MLTGRKMRTKRRSKYKKSYMFVLHFNGTNLYKNHLIKTKKLNCITICMAGFNFLQYKKFYIKTTN